MSRAFLIGRLAPRLPEVVPVSRRHAIAGGVLVLLMAVWGLAAASYFVFRDDIATGLLAKQSAMQGAYEDKIRALRAHLDRLANQGVLDHDELHKRVSEIAARQSQIESRHTILARLAELAAGGAPSGARSFQAEAFNIPAAAAGPSGGIYAPQEAKPTPVPDSLGLRLREAPPSPDNADRRRTSQLAPDPFSLRDSLAALQHSLGIVEGRQMQALQDVASGAEARAERVRDSIREVGLDPDALEEPSGARGTGGPLVPLGAASLGGAFDALVAEAATNVARLDRLGRAAEALPFGRPMPQDYDLTSGFGVRLDPFTRGPALHTGLDFRAEYGSAVRAAGTGEVVSAEYSGGYGNMVEIDHGNGVRTRYAHLSAIRVLVGQFVEPGSTIGRVGSTGRSTGAHLHYETRVNGEAVDPQRFLRAGARLAAASPIPR